MPTDTFAAPQVDLAPKDKWQREHEAFLRLLPGLLATYRGRYVLIHDGQVAAAGDDDLELALAFQREHGNVPIHVGLVTDKPELPARIPHYRTAPGSGDGA